MSGRVLALVGERFVDVWLGVWLSWSSYVSLVGSLVSCSMDGVMLAVDSGRLSLAFGLE